MEITLQKENYTWVSSHGKSLVVSTVVLLGKVFIFFCKKHCAWCFIDILRVVFWESSKSLMTKKFFHNNVICTK